MILCCICEQLHDYRDNGLSKIVLFLLNLCSLLKRIFWLNLIWDVFSLSLISL